MRKFSLKRLVRDKIVSQIQERKDEPDYRVLDNAEYITELKKKIAEEARELIKGEAPESKTLKELADIEEAIDCLLAALDLDRQALSEAQVKRRAENGSFKEKRYIETVNLRDDSDWLDYYLADPEKFKEIK